MKDGLSLHILSSTAAGIVATSTNILKLLYELGKANTASLAVCSPADVIKSRVMSSSEVFTSLILLGYTNVFRTLAQGVCVEYNQDIST
jgi:hypothetical protein